MRPTPPHTPADPVPALDEAAHYERPPGAPRGVTAWTLARTLPPDTLPAGSPVPHPPLILAAARSPDSLTWNPPVWPGPDAPGQPCWRAEETTSGLLTVTAAITADGQITRAWIDQEAPASTAAARLPAMVQHFAAMCHARQAKGITFEASAAPGHYLTTITTGHQQATLAFSRRHRRWDLTAIIMTQDGKLLDTTRTIHDIIRLLTAHEIGTGTPSPTSGARLPRNSALETKKNTVIRV